MRNTLLAVFLCANCFISASFATNNDRKLSELSSAEIDALENRSVEKRLRENHKYDEVRADQDLKWCPQCKCKWEIFEGKVWSSIDKKLWKELICPDCHVR